MSFKCVLVAFGLLTARGEGLSFTRTGRYIPNIKIAEEIDISDVTFTTPPSDSDHLGSVSAPKVSLNHVGAKPRVIIPVVTYHKVTHPTPELLGPPGDSTINYEKRNYGVVVPAPEAYRSLKGRKPKFGPKTKDLLLSSHQSVGPRVVVAPRVAAPAPKYRVINYPPRPVPRPVYYLVGDDPVASVVGDKDRDVAGTSGKFSEAAQWYTEKELQFVKPSKKHPYPKKYAPSSQKKYNHKGKTSDGGRDSDDEEIITSENSDSQVTGRNGDDSPSNGGDRVEFQMYGMDGPNSYKFGYDTGKGDNRHFRFEERDSDGKIKGHYGYMDNEGKMRIMKYEADPETGFHAGPVDYPSEDSN